MASDAVYEVGGDVFDRSYAWIRLLVGAGVRMVRFLVGEIGSPYSSCVNRTKRAEEARSRGIGRERRRILLEEIGGGGVV